MTPQENRAFLLTTAPLVFGPEWQRPLARKLGPIHPNGPRESIDDRLVRRWASGDRHPPDWAVGALRHLALEALVEARERVQALEAIVDEPED